MRGLETTNAKRVASTQLFNKSNQAIRVGACEYARNLMIYQHHK